MKIDKISMKQTICVYTQRVTAVLLFSFLFLSVAFSQTYTLKGKIYDAENQEPLAGATVFLLCTGTDGTTCDGKGYYSIQFNRKECDVRFQYMGYETMIKQVSFEGSKVIVMDIAMKPTQTTLQPVDITAKREGLKKDESVSSVEVIKPKYITDMNITSLDNAFNQTSGLVIVNNEPQMRGGSGFSSGMGSRVMVMMDEMPVMRADAGRPAWNLIPMENIEQIEVLKGAASVLYGSSATTGAINVRTNYPKGKPQTKLTLYNGFYSRPLEAYRCSWDKGTVPLTYGASISHTRRIKKFDLLFSMEYAHDDGFVNMDTTYTTKKTSVEEFQQFMRDSSSFRFGTSSYKKLTKEERFRLNFGLRNQLTEHAIVGLNGILLHSKNTMTHFWANAENGMYNVYPGSLSKMTDFICLLDPYFKYLGKHESSHSIKGRYMYSDNGASNDQDSRSRMFYLEYQYANKFRKLGGLQLFTGAVGQYVRSEGNVFSGISDSNDVVRPKYSENVAVYLQLEKKFLKKKNLTLLGGARYEYFQIHERNNANTKYNDAKPVFRAGINYQIPKTYTSFRTSFGQGYRFPTIGERYLTTRVGNYGFYPNPDLKSETSWNVELGIQQPFKFSVFEGMFDVAAYYQRYKNYVEFFFGPWLTPEQEPEMFRRFGFKFLNTGEAQIMGIDASLAFEAKISKNFKMSLFVAYAFTNPKVLDTALVFHRIENLGYDYTYKKASSDTNGQIMKYRIEHLGKADMDFTFYNMVTVGMSAQYYSQMRNVDYFFYQFDPQSSFAPIYVENTLKTLPFEGLDKYRQAHQDGTWVFGLRAGIEMWNVKLSIIVSNLFNKEYALRPMCPEAPRITTLQIIYKFTEGEPFFPKRKRNK